MKGEGGGGRGGGRGGRRGRRGRGGRGGGTKGARAGEGGSIKYVYTSQDEGVYECMSYPTCNGERIVTVFRPFLIST